MTELNSYHVQLANSLPKKKNVVYIKVENANDKKRNRIILHS